MKASPQRTRSPQISADAEIDRHGRRAPGSGRRCGTGHRAGLVRNLAMVAIVGAALSLAACSSNGTSAPSTSGSGGSGGGPAVSGHTITIKSFLFSPDTLTVAPGTVVTVTNEDNVAHTLSAKGSGGFDTGDIQPGQSTTITAPGKAGSYPYLCDIHQYMTGTLVVSG